METTPVVLMVLGIFVGIPAVIAFTIVGMYRVSGRRTLRAERAAAFEEAVAEVTREERAEAHGGAVGKEPTKEPAQVS